MFSVGELTAKFTERLDKVNWSKYFIFNFVENYVLTRKDNDEVAIKVENRLRKRQYLHIEREIMELLSGCKRTCKLLETGATDTYYYM